MRRIFAGRALAVLTVCALFFSVAPRTRAAEASVEKALEIAVSIAQDDTHGYYNAQLRDRTGNPDYDCASFVCSAFAAAGFDVNPLNSVSRMAEDFTKAGFTLITDIDFSAPRDTYLPLLRPGDILLMDEDVHTEIFYGLDPDSGRYMLVGAHMDYDGAPGDSRGNEVNVRTFYGGFGGSTWAAVLRYGDGLPKIDPYWLETPDGMPYPGDATLDGKVDAGDARFVLRAAVSLERVTPGTPRFFAADMDGSGVVDSADARIVLRAAVGLAESPLAEEAPTGEPFPEGEYAGFPGFPDFWEFPDWEA